MPALATSVPTFISRKLDVMVTFGPIADALRPQPYLSGAEVWTNTFAELQTDADAMLPEVA